MTRAKRLPARCLLFLFAFFAPFCGYSFMAGHIVALGGGGFSMEPDNLALDRYILSLWPSADREPRVCFIPTATGDSAEYIGRFYSAFEKLACRPIHLALTNPQTVDLASAVLENDIFYVGGGNTREMLSVWCRYGLDQALKEAWQAGKILCGISAGAICWFEQAISDSVVEGELHPLKCLGFLPGTACPHYDEPGRRETFHRCLVSGDVGAGYGIDNSVALHFEGTKLVNVVASRPDAYAYHVVLTNGQVAETVIRRASKE
jgi:peptidase E